MSKYMNDPTACLDGLEMLKFFNSRAGRELWAEKPKDIQDEDIKCADQILSAAYVYVQEYIRLSAIENQFNKALFKNNRYEEDNHEHYTNDR